MHRYSTRIYPSITRNNLIALAIILLLLIGMTFALRDTEMVDWEGTFRPAGQAMLRLGSPYEVAIFWNVPWTLIPLLPLVVLPVALSRAILLLANFISVIYVSRRLGADKLTITAILLSPPFIHGALNGNIDWMVMLGFFLVPWLGMFFIAMKPQVGVGVAFYWLIEAWREKGVRGVLILLAPVTLALLFSFVLYGFWAGKVGQTTELWWNASLYPATIPVGLALLVATIRTRDWRWAMAAAPCFAPYVLLHSYIVVLVAMSKNRWETIAAVIGLWIVIALRATGAA